MPNREQETVEDILKHMEDGDAYSVVTQRTVDSWVDRIRAAQKRATVLPFDEAAFLREMDD